MAGMLASLAVDALVAAVLVAGWYFWFRCANRRRAVQILRWIDCAFSGHADISRLHWRSASRFDVELRLCPSVFRRVSLGIELTPREMPLYWLLSRLKRQKETVTFEAELDHRPAVNLHVQNHRWCGRTRRIRPASWRGWQFESLGPMLISTRDDWDKDLGHMLEALLATRSCDFLHVSFRKKAPHFVAAAPLQALSPAAKNSAMFEVLEELASSASASRH
jgi:hypothetical protein